VIVCFLALTGLDSIWGEPVNLGDSINTEADELAPCFAGQSGFLFFERSQNDSPLYDPVVILKSRQENGVWQSAQILSEVINVPGYHTYGPFFDEPEHALYYTNVDQMQSSYLVKSIYSNGEWLAPQQLSDNINGFWYTNYCNLVTTENAFMSHDRNLLFYSKWIWEAVWCIDFYSYIYFSERSNGIDNASNSVIPGDIDISVYPNPSNSTFNIQLYNKNHPVVLKIANVLGQIIYEEKVNKNFATIEWNGKDFNNKPVSSGVYFAIMESKGLILKQKMVLLK